MQSEDIEALRAAIAALGSDAWAAMLGQPFADVQATAAEMTDAADRPRLIQALPGYFGIVAAHARRGKTGVLSRAGLEEVRFRSYFANRKPTVATAKVFATGNSQAARLPKAFRVDTPEVWITRNEHTDEITLRLKPDADALQPFLLDLRSLPASDEFVPLREDAPQSDPLAGGSQ